MELSARKKKIHNIPRSIGSIKIFWSMLLNLNMYERIKYAEFILNI